MTAAAPSWPLGAHDTPQDHAASCLHRPCHRGNAVIFLQKDGISPDDDRIQTPAAAARLSLVQVSDAWRNEDSYTAGVLALHEGRCMD